MHRLPSYQHPHQSGAFVIINESALTHNQSESIVLN